MCQPAESLDIAVADGKYVFAVLNPMTTTNMESTTRAESIGADIASPYANTIVPTSIMKSLDTGYFALRREGLTHSL